MSHLLELQISPLQLSHGVGSHRQLLLQFDQRHVAVDVRPDRKKQRFIHNLDLEHSFE